MILKLPKRLAIISAIFTGCILMLLIFIYLPQRNRMHQLYTQLMEIEDKLKSISSIIEGAEQPDININRLKNKISNLKQKLPQREEYALKAFSDEAHKLNIQLVSVKPKDKQVYLDEKEKPVRLDNMVLYKLSILLEIVCDYKSLGKYLENLQREDFPRLVTVEELKLNKDRNLFPRLRINLLINMYFLQE